MDPRVHEPDRHNDDLLHRIADKVEEIHYTLHGNGEPGLKTRVDRLERSAEGRQWITRKVVGILVGAIIASTLTSAVAVVKLVARDAAAVQREK